MAAVPVTSADTNNTLYGNRMVVRNSSGIPYVVTVDSTNTGIEVYKGNSSTPASFTEQDTADNPETGTLGSVSAAIDSTGVIHIVYAEYVSKSSDLTYITYNTGTDQFDSATDISGDLGEEDSAVTNISTAISIDANDVPHVCVASQFKVGGTTSLTVRYANRVGGSWGSLVEVEGATAGKSCSFPDITINANNLPCISYANVTDGDIGTAIGNANNATSFTLYDISATGVTSAAYAPSIAVDSSGHQHVTYYDTSDYDLKIRKHLISSAWTSWETVEVVVALGAGDTYKGTSLVINGTDRYVFVENTDNDIVYYYDTGSGWTSGGTLETGTYNTSIAKWAFWVDNGSGGSLVTKTVSSSYYFNASDAGPTDIGGAWTNDANAFDSDATPSTYAYTSTDTQSLEGTGTDAPTSGNLIINVEFRIYGGDSTTSGWGDWVTYQNIPSGGWTWQIINDLEIEFSKSSTGLGAAIKSGGSLISNLPWWGSLNSPIRAYKGEVRVTTYERSSATELDYIFTDETASPDVQWNTLTLSAPPAGQGNIWPVFTGNKFRGPSFFR